MKHSTTDSRRVQLGKITSDQLREILSELRACLLSEGHPSADVATILSAGVISAWASTMQELGYDNQRIANNLRVFADCIEHLPEPGPRGDRGQA